MKQRFDASCWHAWLALLLACVLLPYELYVLATQYVLPGLGQGADAAAGALKSTDYQKYTAAAARFLADPLTLYEPRSARTLTGFLYPPPAIVFFLPQSSLALPVAYTLWNALGYAALVAAVIALQRDGSMGEGCARTLPRFAPALVAAALAPTFLNAVYGQVNTLMLLGCVLYYVLARRGRPWSAGAILAAVTWLKLYPALLLLLAVRDRNFRATLPGFVVAAVAVPIVLAPWIPLDLYGGYFLQMVPTMSGWTIPHVLNQSLPAAICRLSLDLPQYVSWTPNGRTTMEIPMAAKAVNAVLMAAAAAVALRKRDADGLGLAVLLAVTPLVAPLGWGYTYVLVVPLVMYAIEGAAGASHFEKVVVAGCILALFIPSYSQPDALRRLPDALQILFYARYALATLMLALLALLAARRRLVPSP